MRWEKHRSRLCIIAGVRRQFWALRVMPVHTNPDDDATATKATNSREAAPAA